MATIDSIALNATEYLCLKPSISTSYSLHGHKYAIFYEKLVAH